MKHELNHETCIAFISDEPPMTITPEAFDMLVPNEVFIYLAFSNLDAASIPSNANMSKKCNMSMSMYKTYKRRLIDKGLLYVKRHSAHGASLTYYFGASRVVQAKNDSVKNEEQTFNEF